jgi:hypothetical protein
MAGYDINYDDSRFKSVEAEKTVALSENEKTYNDMINKTDKYYQDQIDASKQWADKQAQLQQEKTDFTIDKIEQNKEQAKKDYLKEQSGAYVDWQKQSNQYGANAEKMAGAGMANTGFSESSQVSMYNTYQNRVATARESYNLAIQNYNNSITEARLQNNSILAEIAFEALQKQLELSLQGFQYKNTLILDKAEKKRQIDSEYYSRYQDVLKQINTENALAEEIRQYNESLAEEKRQHNEQMAFQREQWEYQKKKAKSSGGGGGSSGGSSSGSSDSKSGGKIKPNSGRNASIKSNSSNTNTMKSIIDLGYGPISAKNLAGKVKSGEVKEVNKNGKTVFVKNPENWKKNKTKKSLTGAFGAISRLK